MTYACRRTSIVLVVLAAACADGITVPPVEAPDAGLIGLTLMDGSQPNAVVQGFYFLPPTVGAPPAASGGTFDPDLSPVIEICPLAGDDPASAAACTKPLLATLDMTSDKPEAIRLDARAENYSSTWMSTLKAGAKYRAFVRVDAATLGYVDLYGTKKQKDTPPAGFVGVVAGQPFVFKFRIEEGIAGVVTIDPAAATIRDVGTPGESQVFTATVLDLHGNPLPGVQVAWSPSDASLVDLTPLSGTTDGAGTTTTTATALEHVATNTLVDVTAVVMSASATAQLTVRPSSRPIGQPDAYGIITGTTLAVAAPGVLLNDLDPEGDPLTVTPGANGVAHGTLSLQPDGSFTYTPGAGFIGTDGFDYVATDPNGNQSLPVAVTIEVLDPPAETPVTLPDMYAVVEGKTLTVPASGFLANDIDPNGDPVTAVLIAQGVQHGSLTAFPDGSFTYTPTPGYVGTDSFQYVATDPAGHSTSPTTVTIQVLEDPDRVPVGTPDRYVVVAGTSLSIAAPGFLANDVDSDGLALTATLIAAGVQHGLLTAFPNGSFTYTPSAGYVGGDGFEYRMQNSAGVPSASIAVTIEVLPATTTGPLATPDAYVVFEGKTLSVANPAAGFLANDRDASGGTVTATLITDDVDHGGLTAFPDGTFSYTPAAGFTGTDQFVYRMQNSGAVQASATVTITVLPDLDKDPVAVPDEYTVFAGSGLTIASAGAGFVANDMNPDGGAVTATLITDDVDHGGLTAFPAGTFTYTPSPGFTGDDAFTYQIQNAANRSAQAVVTLHVVEDPNGAPVLLPDYYALIAGGSLSVLAPGFLGNDVDREGEAITATLITDDVDHGALTAFPDGSFTYTPTAGFAGTDAFTYQAADASGHPATATVTIEVIDPAVASASQLARLRAMPTIIATDGAAATAADATPLQVGEARTQPMRDAFRDLPALQGEPLPVITGGRTERPEMPEPDLSAFAGKRRLEVVRNR